MRDLTKVKVTRIEFQDIKKMDMLADYIYESANKNIWMAPFFKKDTKVSEGWALQANNREDQIIFECFKQDK